MVRSARVSRIEYRAGTRVNLLARVLLTVTQAAIISSERVQVGKL